MGKLGDWWERCERRGRPRITPTSKEDGATAAIPSPLHPLNPISPVNPSGSDGKPAQPDPMLPPDGPRPCLTARRLSGSASRCRTCGQPRR
jgi:hypothetical protein